MGQIRKIQKDKEERDGSGKFKKNKKERMEEQKRRDFVTDLEVLTLRKI
jgi:hypothetical protein